MKNILESLNGGYEIPEFMSCTSFEYPEAEFILYSGAPKLLFAVLEEIEGEEPQFMRHIEHENGDEDYVVVAQCLTPEWFEDKDAEQAKAHIESIMDELEGWYISEVIDLDSYED